MNLVDIAKKRYRGPVAIRPNYLYKLNLMAIAVGDNNMVLELGCGDGILTNMMRPYNDVISIDLEKGDLHVDLQKGQLPALTDSMDVVVASELIEHIMDVDKLLKEVHRVLKPNGRLVISTPNLASLGRRVLLLAGRNPYVENFLYPNEAGHVKHYTFKDFKYLLEKNGFKVSKMYGDVVVLPGLFSKVLAKLFPRLSRCIIAEGNK